MFPLIPKTKSSVLVRVITKGKPTLILRRMKFCRPLQNPITLYRGRYKEELNRCIYFYGWVFLGFCRCGTYLSSAGIDFLSSFQELINISVSCWRLSISQRSWKTLSFAPSTYLYFLRSKGHFLARTLFCSSLRNPHPTAVLRQWQWRPIKKCFQGHEI